MKESNSRVRRKVKEYRIPVFRIVLVKEAVVLARPITSAHDVAEQMTDVSRSDREQMVCLLLNTKNRPIGRQTVSVGTLNSSIVHPREIFKGAILRNASIILLVHNHPSGDPAPSREDDELTKRLARVGVLHGIQLLDHVIVSPAGRFYSYQEENPDLLKGG